MGKIYMTACMKGGCAKTVTTYNLAYSLQKLGKKVLAVDFDSQANLTTCFGVGEPAAVPVTIGHLMMAQIDDEELPAPEEYIMSRNGVDFIPSSRSVFYIRRDIPMLATDCMTIQIWSTFNTSCCFANWSFH